MESNYITTQGMLRNVMSRFGLRDIHGLPVYDMIAWMGEAAAHIGSYKNLESTTAKVTIVNYTGKFPLDMHALIRVQEYHEAVSSRGGFRVPLESGEVTIEYDRFPVDAEGMPLFSNNPSTIDAISWYVAKFLALQGKLPNGNITHQYCNQQWQWYCGQARAEGYVPTIDQWNRMVNVFYRLIPQKDEFIKSFEGLNSPEELSLDSKNEFRYGRNYLSTKY